MQRHNRLCGDEGSHRWPVRLLSYQADVVGPRIAVDAARVIFPSPSLWIHDESPNESRQVTVERAGRSDDLWRIVEDGGAVRATGTLPDVASKLEWVINGQAVASLTHGQLLFHAGAVALDGAGIVLPARSGSGKSTLTAALVADGFTYFSDEVAVIDPDSLSLLPFAKSIKVRAGSIPSLTAHFPDLSFAGGNAGNPPQEAFLRPPDDAWPRRPASVTRVVFPQYVRGERTQLTSISRSDGFSRLIAHSFSARENPARSFGDIIRLIQQCECYELVVGNLAKAVDQVRAIATR